MLRYVDNCIANTASVEYCDAAQCAPLHVTTCGINLCLCCNRVEDFCGLESMMHTIHKILIGVCDRHTDDLYHLL